MTYPKEESGANPSYGTLYKGGKRATPSRPKAVKYPFEGKPKPLPPGAAKPKPLGPYNPKKPLKMKPMPYPAGKKPKLEDLPYHPGKKDSGSSLNFSDMISTLKKRGTPEISPEKRQAIQKRLSMFNQRRGQGTKKSGEGK